MVIGIVPRAATRTEGACASSSQAFREGVLAIASGFYDIVLVGGPEDIQFAEVHDCFSIAELIHIEDLGFFKPGQAYKAVEQGATRLDGPMPINTRRRLASGCR